MARAFNCRSNFCLFVIDLKRWLQDQWGTEEDWREIPDKIELAPGVVIEIPKPRIVMPFGLRPEGGG